MNNSDNKINDNKKIMIGTVIILLLIIVPLIFFSFTYSKYHFEITTPIIILISLLIVVLLSNSFDNFQIGKLLSLKRNVTEYKERNEKLENDKSELIKQIINLNMQSQHTSNVNYNGIPLDVLKKGISVEQVDEEEAKSNKSHEDSEILTETKNIHRRINRRKLESFAIKKCFGDINYNSILQQVKLNNKFGDNDPISNRDIVFDAFYNDNEKERFIEVNQYASIMLYDRLYVMLNKIYNYRNIKNSNANLTLIIPKLPEDNRILGNISNDIDRLKEVFSPAIASGLFSISQIDISKEELENLLIEK